MKSKWLQSAAIPARHTRSSSGCPASTLLLSPQYAASPCLSAGTRPACSTMVSPRSPSRSTSSLAAGWGHTLLNSGAKRRCRFCTGSLGAVSPLAYQRQKTDVPVCRTRLPNPVLCFKQAGDVPLSVQGCCSQRVSPRTTGWVGTVASLKVSRSVGSVLVGVPSLYLGGKL